jgi:hypothetical protein
MTDDIADLLAAQGQRLQELGKRMQSASLAAMSRGALDLDLAHGALDAGWPKVTDWALPWPAPWRYGRN